MLDQTQSEPNDPNYNEQEVYIRNGINAAVGKFHHESLKRGWWIRPRHSELTRDNEIELYMLGTKIALIHSEVSEALEGLRKGGMDEHLPTRKSVEVELADTLIRIFDLAGRLELELGEVVIEKGRFNAIRADHNLENRSRPDGKKF